MLIANQMLKTLIVQLAAAIPICPYTQVMQNVVHQINHCAHSVQ